MWSPERARPAPLCPAGSRLCTQLAACALGKRPPTALCSATRAVPGTAAWKRSAPTCYSHAAPQGRGVFRLLAQCEILLSPVGIVGHRAVTTDAHSQQVIFTPRQLQDQLTVHQLNVYTSKLILAFQNRTFHQGRIWLAVKGL